MADNGNIEKNSCTGNPAFGICPGFRAGAALRVGAVYPKLIIQVNMYFYKQLYLCMSYVFNQATNIVQNSTQNLIKINQKSFKISSMGADWAVLVAGTRVYGVLEASWSRPGRIQSVLEVFTNHLGDVLGRLGGILRTSWGAVKASCGRFGGI